jgi:hypothetical protein
VVGASIGYFGNTSMRNVTVIKSCTMTVTAQGSTVLRCVVTLYESWFAGVVSGSSTRMTTTVRSISPLQTFTTTGTQQTVGYSTVTTAYYTGVTVTGAINMWNSTTCTYISG